MVWRPQTPAFGVPYVPAIVDLDEGWRGLSCIVGCEHDAVTVGMRVRVEFHPTPDGITLRTFGMCGSRAGLPQSPLRERVEHPEELGRHRRIQLGVSARLRFPVGAPPLKMGPVAEAIVLQVVVGHLAHQLRP